MARFIADVIGQQGAGTSRIGSAKSGIQSHTRGWTAGVRVIGFVRNDDRDYFEIHVTGGSRGERSDEWLATVNANGEVTINPKFLKEAATP